MDNEFNVQLSLGRVCNTVKSHAEEHQLGGPRLAMFLL